MIEQDWNNADAHYNLGVLYAVSSLKILKVPCTT